jgi:hypothetical protein
VDGEGDGVTERSVFDLDLLIDRSGDSYRARVLRSPAGEGQAVTFRRPFSDLELENFLLRMGRSRGRTRRIESAPVIAAKEFGGRLFAAVFTGQVGECLHRSVDRAQDYDATLRIRLRLSDCPELADIPWEFLYDKDDDWFIALSDVTPVVRYVQLAAQPRPLRVALPLRVLAIRSEPSDHPSLDLETEWAQVMASLSEFTESGAITVTELAAPTLSELRRALLRERFHVLHYMGHGGFTAEHGGVLLFTDQAGRGAPVTGEHLSVMLRDHTSLRLAVLNACEAGRTDAADPFGGIADTLVRRGIPAVIAMQFEISDTAAIEFAPALYGALAAGRSVDAAVAEARKAIYAVSPLEWATPVLHLRADNAHLFDIPQPASPSPRGQSHSPNQPGDTPAQQYPVAEAETALIVALAQALIRSVDGGGQPGGDDAYQALKARILRKYPGATASIERLEEDPYSEERQAALAAILHDLGGTNDQELRQLADQLMAAIHHGRSDSELDPDSAYAYPGDQVTQTKRLVGIRVINQTFGEHIQRVSDLRSSHPMDHSSLLASNISRARDVPVQVRDQVASLHKRIRQIIGQVAASIEDSHYRDVESSVQDLPSHGERERATKLVQADKEICTSYETLRLTVDYFSELNLQVLEQTEREASPQRQGQMMFGNAIMIYEFADFMIDFIRGFSPGGLTELESLHEETLERIHRAKTEQERLKARARHDDIEASVSASVLDNLRQRDGALEVLQQGWQSYVAQTRQLHERIATVQDRIPTLELIRDNARLQLDVLDLVAMLRFLRQNDEAIRAAVRTVQGLRLVPLTSDRIRRLLEINH